MSYIKSLVLEYPEYEYTQEEVLEKAKELLPRWTSKKSAVKVFENAGIEKRAFALPLEAIRADQPLTASRKAEVFERVARDLGARAGRLALDRAGLNSSQVDAIITVTTTGLLTPSLSAKIALDLGLRLDVCQLPHVGWGCCGGVLGLSAARDAVRAGYKQVLLINVELCSTTFLQSDEDLSNFVGTALFADGAAALVVSSDSTDALAELHESHCTLLPDTEQIMGWQTKSDGWKVIFGAEVPEVAAEHLPATIEAVLDRLGWQRADVDRWLPHPGGPKVLHGYESAVDDTLPEAWETLRLHGNMSSVSVLAVLEQARNWAHQGSWEDQGRAIVSAMGPGFNIAHIGITTLR